VRRHKDNTDNTTLPVTSFRPFLIEKLLFQHRNMCDLNYRLASQPHTAVSVNTVNKNQGTRKLTELKVHCEFEKLLSGTGQVEVLFFQPCSSDCCKLPSKFSWG